MRFDFYALRFEFRARESLHFPAGKAGNILRGALGLIFRQLACQPHCPGAKQCDIRLTCPYARIFEPVSEQGPSGLADSPRPFVFRARHLDGRTIEPGAKFHFDLNVFIPGPAILTWFIQTFTALVREGLGPRRGKAELTAVYSLTEEGAAHPISAGARRISLSLDPLTNAPAAIQVDFVSPTELKHEQKIVSRPEFPILFSRIRDRISTLRHLYGEGPLEVDFKALAAKASTIKMTACQMQHEETDRRSSRTGQSHSIGGFTGTAHYEGDLTDFLPYLNAARWTGVGRQSVWGKGEIRITLPNRPQ